MNINETPQDRPEPRQASAEPRYARRIDCAPRPRPAEHAAPAVAEPPRPRDDAHR